MTEKKKKDEIITFKVTSETKEKLKEIAAYRNTKVSKIISALVDEEIIIFNHKQESIKK